jgi:hypothetical protein
MYILKNEGVEWVLVRNDSVVSPVPRYVKKFSSIEDALLFLKDDAKK